ncbi:MAG: hypothetical protein CSA70_11025 [Rhodobacterales bacterium]|nr:MAG: hypothetical protein CSA70_11025 [Rhodobacterales bacterium]
MSFDYIWNFSKPNACPALSARQDDRDRYRSQPKGEPHQTADEDTGVLVSQTRDTCKVEDRGVLMTVKQRNRVTGALESPIRNDLPQLKQPNDPMPDWDHFHGRVLHNPQVNQGKETGAS